MADRWFEVELSLRGWIRVKLNGDIHEDEDQKYTEQQAAEAAMDEVSWDWSKLNADWDVEECLESDDMLGEPRGVELTERHAILVVRVGVGVSIPVGERRDGPRTQHLGTGPAMAGESVKYFPAEGGRLERYEVADGAVVLGIANEGGDITAFVRRPDGTYGHCYGGPVYEPPEFTNVCARPDPLFHGRWVCDHKTDMTAAERSTADTFARKVGWMPEPCAPTDGTTDG